MFDELKALCEINGSSGDEGRVREYIRGSLKIENHPVESFEELLALAEQRRDACFTDNLGNLIVFRHGKSKPKNRLMFAAHMDEVGLMITDIRPDGLLKTDAVGWIDARVVGCGALVTERGVPCVVGRKAVHHQSSEERKTAPALSELYLDIGAKDKEASEKLVSRGEYVYFGGDFFRFGSGSVCGKAIDDRAGCLALIGLINGEPEFDAWYAFTVQEEIGTRGAKTAAYQISPDIAFVIETTTACDIAGVSGDKRVCELGKGAVVSFMDRSTIYDKGLYSLAMKKAGENGIPVQTKTLIAGGNDSGAIHVSRGGVRTLAISVPCRNLHSPSCVMRESDFEAVCALAKVMMSAAAEL